MAPGRRQVVWSQRARDALDEAIGYIWKDSPTAAQRLLQRIIETAATLESLSERGRVVREIEDPSLRELLVKPYRLMYEVGPTTVVVLALLHEARDFATWQRERSGL